MPYFGVPIRNGLPIGLGSQAGFGIAPFDPRDLFSAGEQGAWYDPSDYSTLFTDNAGTTPVTAVEQFVGLMLDKSKGLVLGPELITNGDFSSGTTNWPVYLASATFAVVGGVGTVTTVTSSGGVYQDFSGLTIGRTYRFSVLVTAGTANAIIQIGTSPFTGAAFQQIGANGQITGVFVASATTLSISLRVNNASAGQTCLFDNISVRELPGNHATSTGTKRPKLAARYNLLTYTEQFDNGAWQKTSTTAANTTATTDPLGGTTADIITHTAASGEVLQQTSTTTSAGTYTFSVYFKYNTFQWVRTVISNATANGAFWFDIQNGVLGTYTVGAGITYVGHTITSVGDGWYRCTAALTLPSSAGAFEVWFNSASANGSNTRVTGSMYAWGAQLIVTNSLLSNNYQRVVDAATYDTVGFLPYLQFDGIDDSMSTGSIDATAVDKAQVFVGARALSMSLTAMIAEFSASVSANNGSLVIYTENTITFNMLSKGTVLQVAASAVQSPPVTRVLCGIADIAAPLSAIRVDGTQVNNTAAQGAGNFGNYPLFIGMRNNASFPFNGWLSSLIVRFGANLSQSQISATESWVNGRTGAY